MGMQITAVGEVEVSGNHIIGSRGPESGYAGDGLLLIGAMSGPMRPQVRGNVIEDCFLGMTGYGLAEAVLSDNEVRSRARNLTFRTNGRLSLTDNRLLGPVAGGWVVAADLTATGNLVDARIMLGATGTLEVSSNTFRQRLLIGGSAARGRIAQNTMTDVSIGGAGEFEIEDNDGQSLQAKALVTVVAAANRFSGLMRVRAADTAEVSENDAGALTVRGAVATVRRNAVAGKLHVAADTAAVAENSAGSLVGRALPDSADRDTAFLIEDNAIAGPIHTLGPAATVVRRNTVAGQLTAIARHDIDIAQNQTKGIACIVLDAGGRVSVVANDARQSAGPGLMVVGAETATIENNRVSDNAENGLAIRRTVSAVVAGNELRSNASGGVSVRVPPLGDCNEDADVTVADVLTMVGVGLQRRPLHDCDAADVDRDQTVTIGEIVLSVGGALGVPDTRPSTVTLRDNRVENNARFGIDVFARGSVLVTGNRVLHNGGIPLAIHGRDGLGDALLSGNVLGLGAAEGLLVEALGAARIRNNVVFSNRDAGLLLRATPGAAVVNNLVYANGGAGIAVGVGDQRPTTAALVMNNTIFANGGWGILVGSGTAASTGTMIRNNILRQNVRGGISATPGALPDLMVGFNINSDGYGDGVSPEPTDLSVDPQFVAPAGNDGVLGNDAFADDDFRLQPTSPAIDAGSAPAAELGISGSAVAGRTDDVGHRRPRLSPRCARPVNGAMRRRNPTRRWRDARRPDRTIQCISTVHCSQPTCVTRERPLPRWRRRGSTGYCLSRARTTRSCRLPRRPSTPPACASRPPSP